MNSGGNCGGVRHIGAVLGNTRVLNTVMKAKILGVGCRNVVTNTREGCICFYCEFGLKAESWRSKSSGTSEGTNLEDAMDLIEFQLPGSNRLSVTPRAELAGEDAPLTPLDNFPLDLGQGTMIVIEDLVSKVSGVGVTGSTHVANRPIALEIVSPIRSSPSPFITRSRV